MNEKRFVFLMDYETNNKGTENVIIARQSSLILADLSLSKQCIQNTTGSKWQCVPDPDV